jgi:hypothetical protein
MVAVDESVVASFADDAPSFDQLVSETAVPVPVTSVPVMPGTVGRRECGAVGDVEALDLGERHQPTALTVVRVSSETRMKLRAPVDTPTNGLVIAAPAACVT